MIVYYTNKACFNCDHYIHQSSYCKYHGGDVLVNKASAHWDSQHIRCDEHKEMDVFGGRIGYNPEESDDAIILDE